MSAPTVVQSVPASFQYSAPRVISIDVFRGLTMAVMIFVNAQSEIKGLPWWNYHMAANIDAMTYVDMVFPAFLFILGMAIPLAVRQRLKRSASVPLLWAHILFRSLGLLVLGLILANADEGNSSLMRMSTSLWAIVALFGAVLLWGVYPSSARYRKLFFALRIIGGGLIVLTFSIFRRTTPSGHIAWINTSYPEILGLLGFTYLAVCILYVPMRNWRWAPLAWFVILTSLCVATSGRWITALDHVPLYFWPYGNGAMASIAMAGVFTSSIFTGELSVRWPHFRQKAIVAISFATLSLVAGWLLTPFGISKIRATPTWCLYDIAFDVFLVTLLYWICDVKKKTAWTSFVWAAGVNTLLVYLLPDFYYFLLKASGIDYFEYHWNHGFPGSLRALIFTALILAVATYLTKRNIKLRL